MAQSISLVQPCGNFFSCQHWTSTLILEARGGYRNALSRKMRTPKFYRSKHKLAEKILEEVSYGVARRSGWRNLLNKVSALVDSDGFHDSNDNERDGNKPAINLKDAMSDFDVSMACKRFPSISLGSCPSVVLYEDTISCSGTSYPSATQSSNIFLPNSDSKCVDLDDHSEMLPSQCTVIPNVISSSSTKDDSPSLPLSPDFIRTMTSETAGTSVCSVMVEESSAEVSSKVEPDFMRTMTSETAGTSVCSVMVEESSAEVSSKLEPDLMRTMTSETAGTPVCSVMVEESSAEISSKEEPEYVSLELSLDRSISCIPRLSKKQCLQLEDCGFHTLRKLLHHFPRTYADLQNAQVGIEDGQYLISVGKILSSRGIKASFSLSFLEVVVACEIADSGLNSEHLIDDVYRSKKKTIYLHLKKFFRGTRFTNQPFLNAIARNHEEGQVVCVSGKVKTMRMKDHYEIREYNIDVLKDEDDLSLSAQDKPYPIYPSKGGLNPNFLRDVISRALQTLPINVDPVPEAITKDFGLLDLHEAYVGIHQPKCMNEADLARKRLLFDEFLYLQLGRLFQMLEGLGSQIEKDGLLDKYRKPQLNALHIEEWSSLTKKLLEALPYSLTSSQLSAVKEIIWDLKRPVPMNRLLQGDVGCGKTVVALLACMEVIGSGYQAAFMAPTELLAIQHYDLMLNLLENMDVQCKPSVALLTGSIPTKQTRMIRQGLKDGDISLAIGTHSLISESVEFAALRLSVVDEQHRFGVIQRGRFNSKLYNGSLSSRTEADDPEVSSKSEVHMAPHILAMSATPIPRTLALALYGDMSITQITDLPPGRTPVETFVVQGNDNGYDEVYKMMRDELETGGKVYIVYPVIDQSEQLPQLRAAAADLEAMSLRFEGYKCGLLHGRMKGATKDEALTQFRSGETHILLATQVIEVGVDVPDASMMVVMNAERFGIAQLHQLRGRVGRGTRKSKCILVGANPTSLSRLEVLGNSSDGFHLANMDLLMRGPGDLLGRKQSGHLPEFPVARLEIDGNLLNEAHLAAMKIVGSCHDLEKYPKLKAELSMRQPLSFLGD